MRRVVFGLAAAIAITVPSASALAHGKPVTVFTDTTTGEQTSPFEDGCTGVEVGDVTTVFRNTFHVTEFADEHYVVKGNTVGTFFFDPYDPLAPTATGRFRDGFTDTFTGNTGGFNTTLIVVGRDANGDKVGFSVRVNFKFANGEVRVDEVTLTPPCA